MKRKVTNQKENYTVEMHAIEMFDNNYKYFLEHKDEFDILPFSEEYYSENKICFRHIDRAEINIFISILIKEGYIENTRNEYNIVRLTLKGETHLSTILERISRNPYRI